MGLLLYELYYMEIMAVSMGNMTDPEEIITNFVILNAKPPT